MAQIQAFIGNALGGKSHGGKALPAHKRFTPVDFLPHFARPEGFEDEPLLPPHVCWMFLEAADNGGLSRASWVVQAILLSDDLERITKVAEEYGALLEEEKNGLAAVMG